MKGKLAGAATWTKETLIKESKFKQMNRRGHKTLTTFGAIEDSDAGKRLNDIEEMVQFYN